MLPGADPARGATPGMIGYGLAKAAVHQLTKSLAAPKSGLPDGAQVFAILPGQSKKGSRQAGVLLVSKYPSVLVLLLM